MAAGRIPFHDHPPIDVDGAAAAALGTGLLQQGGARVLAEQGVEKRHAVSCGSLTLAERARQRHWK